MKRVRAATFCAWAQSSPAPSTHASSASPPCACALVDNIGAVADIVLLKADRLNV
jgi:hypothetical protein